MKLSPDGTSLIFNNKIYPCVIGKKGLSNNKHEGDETTPMGLFSLESVWFRSDRIQKPQCALPLFEITPDDGWCDDPISEFYNKPISIKNLTQKDQKINYEYMYRDDFLYNIVIVISYNRARITAYKGSSVFIHCIERTTTLSIPFTKGCIALAQRDLLSLLPQLKSDTLFSIYPQPNT